MRIYLVATFVYPECLGLFYLRALKSLGHDVDVWDPRMTPEAPTYTEKTDLTIVVKEFVNPLSLPRPRVYIFPDQTMHENYSTYLDVITPRYDAVFFCMRHPTNIMNRYNARLLPFGIDAELHKPLEMSRDIDVSFIGTNRPGRTELINFLSSHGVKIRVWGNNWPSETPNYVGKAIYLTEKQEVNSRSKIVLNHHYLCDMVGANMRFFEALGMQCFMLSDVPYQVEELGFIDGQHYASYSNEPDNAWDLLDKIKRYLEDERHRKLIAAQGSRFVHENHTYNHRVKEMLASI
jgi:spore maturation protein CgeB